MVVLAIAFCVCSSNDSVVKPGDPSVSEKLRERRGEPLIKVTKDGKKLVFLSKKGDPDMFVPEKPYFIRITNINLDNELVIIEGREINFPEFLSFEIMINQSNLIKDGKVNIRVNDHVNIDFVLKNGERHYFIRVNYTKRLILAEWQ